MLDETSEEKDDEAEEPETSTKEQAGFDLAQVWMEEGGSLALAEGESQRLLIQVFSFELLSLLFCLAVYLSVPAQGHIQAT